MKKTLLQFVLFLTSLVMASAQNSNVKLVFPTPANVIGSEGEYLIQTADGGYLLTGSTNNNLGGGYQRNPRLIKLSADLQVEWDKNYLEIPPPHGVTATLYSPALQTPDGGYAMAFRNDSTTTDFMRLDASGNVLWEKNFVQYSSSPMLLLDVLPDGGFLLACKLNNYTLYRMDANGNIVFQRDLLNSANSGAVTSIMLANGDILTAYRTNNTKMNLLRTDADGNTIWQKQPLPTPVWVDNQGGPDVAATSDGGFMVLAYDVALGNNRIYRFNDLGEQTWLSPETAFPNTLRPVDIAVNANDQVLLSGSTITNRGFTALLNAAGDAVEWVAESPEDGQEPLTRLSAIPTSDGWAAGVGQTNGDNFGFLKVNFNSGVTINMLSGRVAKDDDDNCAVDALESGVVHARVNATNGLETFGAFSDGNGGYKIALPAGDFTLGAKASEIFFSPCAGANLSVSFPPNVNGVETRDIPMQSPELIHEISGKVYLDQDNNCQIDAGEPTLEGWLVTVHTALGNIYLKTDVNGAYKVFVPDGDYQVYTTPYNNNFSVCGGTQSITLIGPDPQVASLDFVSTPDFLCAKMEADLGSNNIRPCLPRVLYAYYRNNGTTTANGATLTVTLDPMLEYTSASQTPDVIDGQVLTFYLGDVPATPGSNWKVIDVHVMTSCDLQIGDQVCASVAVTPAEDCTEEPGWSGAIVSADGTCNMDDEAVFIIKNIGSAQNVQVLDYIITEDFIVLKQGQFQLQPGQEVRDTVPGNGLPLTLIAQQEPGFPGDTSVVWNIVNCGGNGGGSNSGFGGPAGLFTHQECFPVVNSNDPNDKSAKPVGFGPQHFVHPGTPLEYHIRFQNTGNDTAYLVVIRDTLSQHFDLSKIEPRGSSHRYEFAQISDSIIQFTFKNILLPDSTTNLEGSQGFVDFSIYPKANLADGTEVLNSAAIYFDFNEPVITNTVSRIYGKYVVEVVKTKEINGKPVLPVTVYPNPFVTETTFEIPESAAEATYQLSLFDASGRTLRTLSFDNQKCLLRRDDLPAGVMTWSITANGTVVAGGKLAAQ